jgi:hypothetical protein
VAGVGILVWRVPQLWRDRGGGQELSAEGLAEAVSEVTSELGEGEPL